MLWYLLAIATMLTIAFLWLGDYGDCKVNNYDIEYWYRIYAVILAVLLVLFLRGGGYIDEDGDFITHESELLFALAPLVWFITISIISKFSFIVVIYIFSLIGILLEIGKSAHVNFLPFLYDFAILGFLLFAMLYDTSGKNSAINGHRHNGVWDRISSGYSRLHYELSIKFRWLRNKCAMRLGFYRNYSERFNTYYSMVLQGQILRGNHLFMNELDLWMHRELKNDNLIIVKKWVLDDEISIDAAVILSCYKILKNDKELAKRVKINQIKNHALFFDVIGSALVLCRETVVKMRRNDTLDLDNAANICELVNEMSDKKSQIAL